MSKAKEAMEKAIANAAEARVRIINRWPRRFYMKEALEMELAAVVEPLKRYIREAEAEEVDDDAEEE